MAKQLLFKDEARQSMLRGVEKIASAVKSTLGPGGRTVVLAKKFGDPVITKDGVTVAKEIDLSDPYEQIGAQLVKSVSSKTNDVVGDGTTTSAVLAEAIYKEGLRNVMYGANAIEISRGINMAARTVAFAVSELATPVQDSESIFRVANVSANGDAEVAHLITNAMEAVGKDGIITVEESKTTESSMEVVSGMQVDKGYLSPYFITDTASMTVEYEDAYIFVIEEKLSAIQPLVGLLDSMSRLGRPFIIIADEVEGQVLATMVTNRLRGAIKCVAVRAPGYGDRRRAMLEDIAIATGATFISKDLGVNLADIALDMRTQSMPYAGTVGKLVVTKDETIIANGGGNPDLIAERVAQIKKQLAETTSEYDRDKLSERLAKLSGGVAILKIGASTDAEMREKKDRVDDALHATRAAVEEGIVPGGGLALLNAKYMTVEESDPTIYSADMRTGTDIIRRVLDAPMRQIIANAGDEPGAVMAEVLRANKKWKFTHGYNAATRSVVDMLEAGIVDPAKVVRNAILNASSVAGLMLTTECIVTDEPGDKGCSCHPTDQMAIPLG